LKAYPSYFLSKQCAITGSDATAIGHVSPGQAFRIGLGDAMQAFVSWGVFQGGDAKNHHFFTMLITMQLWVM
jgi:hypothetical protein